MYGGSPLKLQINSVEALERLIGGDSEVEIEIRNSVAQEFAKKHLKKLAEDSLYQPALADIKSEMEKFISSRYGSYVKTSNYSTKFELNDQIKAQIKSEVSAIVTGICRRELIEKGKELREKMDLDNYKWEVTEHVRRSIKEDLVRETVN